jgi:hypothetical protein
MNNKDLHDDTERVERMIDERPWLFSPIPCAAPSEEPQVDEVISQSDKPLPLIARSLLQ